MKIVLKILKWVVKAVGLFLTLIILAGLCLRLFGPEPHKPEGKLVDVEGVNFHINSSGEKNDKPTVIIEAGAGLPTEFYHWLNEGLKDSLRVVRYDRAGLGYSDELTTPRDPETISRELHALLEKAGESPPYIMMGHSMGGPYIRVFTQLYPKEVVALFFLDATHHAQVERYNAPKQSSFKYKAFMWTLGLQSVLADMGMLTLQDKLFGTPYSAEGLPDAIDKRTKDMLANGKSFRAYDEEMKYYHHTLDRSAEADDFGALTIRSFTAIREESEKSVSEENTSLLRPKEETKYVEFEDLSTNGKHIGISGNHLTIFTKKENAKIICKEVLKISKEN